MLEDGFFNDSKNSLSLDDYGYPGASVANRLLLEQDDFGESVEDLAEEWETWLHHMPFDAEVGRALLVLLHERAADLDSSQDAGARQRLERKIQLARDRTTRYGRAAFSR
jgi:hypothetical protein